MNFRELWILKLKFKFEVIFAAKCHRLNTWILCTEMRKFMIIWSHNIGKFLPYCHRQQNSFLIIHFVCATGHKFLANFITSFSSGFCLGFFLLNFAQPLFQLNFSLKNAAVRHLPVGIGYVVQLAIKVN